MRLTATGISFILLFTFGIFIPVLVSAICMTYASDWMVENAAIHASIETAGGIFALALATILISSRAPGQDRHYCWVSSALILMGVFDLVHSVSGQIDPFVWFHTCASLSGGLLFSMAWFTSVTSESLCKRLHLIAGVLAVLVYILFYVYPWLIPRMIDGVSFTWTAMVLNVLGGLGFFAGAVWLTWRCMISRAWEDYLFVCLGSLFGTASMLFAFSIAWNLTWWVWHCLRLLAYFLALLYATYVYRREISDRKRFEGSLYETIERRNELLDSLEHELRTPLGSIEILAGNISEGVYDSDPGKLKEKGGKNIFRHVIHARSILNRMLVLGKDLATPDDEETQYINLGEFLDELREIPFVPNELKSLVEFDIISEGLHDVWVQMSKQDMMSVFGNLVINGAEAIVGSGIPGVVSITLLDCDDEFIDLVVKDTGPGIKDRTGLFYGTSTKRPHNNYCKRGQGLKIVKIVLDRWGGEISLADYTEGEGASFTVRLRLFFQKSE